MHTISASAPGCNLRRQSLREGKAGSDTVETGSVGQWILSAVLGLLLKISFFYSSHSYRPVFHPFCLLSPCLQRALLSVHPSKNPLEIPAEAAKPRDETEEVDMNKRVNTAAPQLPK